MSKKLYIKTYGCQMNVYDSDRMVDLLRPLGYQLTDDPVDADIAILNTCHIREKAEQKVYSDLGRLRQHQTFRHQQGKSLLIAVGGCVAQAEGDEILRQAPYVNMVFGPQTYHRLPEMIAKILRRQESPTKRSGRGIVDIDFPLESKFDTVAMPESSPVSAFLSIQEGCDKFCTFCVVPYTRGAEYSRPARDILREANHLVELGAKEITLLGQNVNAYHGEAPALSQHGSEWNLGRLLRELATIPGLERLRYTTSHPRDMDQDLIDAHGEIPQLMPFLHLPVQSGSDRILQAMNRKHTVKEYLTIIERLRSARSDMAFSSDFIVGFPGETTEDHQATLDLIQKVSYAQAYSFKYSIRPGTPAGSMDLQVPEETKKDRLHELQQLVNQQQLNFNQACVGTVQRVLFDRVGQAEGQLLGKTAYMQSVPLEAPKRLFGTLMDVIITEAHANSITGEIITQN